MRLFVFAIFGIWILLLARPLYSECRKEDQIPNQYIVRLKKSEISPHAVTIQTESFLSRISSKATQASVVFSPTHTAQSVAAWEVDRTPPTTLSVTLSSQSEFEDLSSDPEVESVEPNCLFKPLFTTNDPSYNSQWGLAKVQAPKAWDITRGSKDIIISISDTGVDYLHEDLKDNMWVNTKETPGNRIDDDNNGCIDDIYGCDLANNTGDPMPTNSNLLHGTHVAGIAGATGNNGKGVSGLSQVTRIMGAKGFANSGSGSTDALLKTIYYSVENGARVINCSWGRSGSPSASEVDAFKYAISKGVVVVVAAGNDNKNASSFSPAAIPDVITVAATDSVDQIAQFSNWGTVIDVAAPGGKGYNSSRQMVDGIFATLPRADGNYGNLIGTSMAAPFVAGLAGLVLSVNPKLNHFDVLRIMKDGGDLIKVTTAGSGMKFDYMRINAFKAVQLAQASLGDGGNGGGSGNDGSDCEGDDCNSDFSGIKTPDTISSAFKNNGSGCGMIDPGNTQGPSNPKSAGLVFLLPVILAFALRRTTQPS